MNIRLNHDGILNVLESICWEEAESMSAEQRLKTAAEGLVAEHAGPDGKPDREAVMSTLLRVMEGDSDRVREFMVANSGGEISDAEAEAAIAEYLS